MKKLSTKPAVIHYHKDTEDICNKLIQGQAYATSKGTLIFQQRSQSNGKILFNAIGQVKNVYFTKQEWIDGKNKYTPADPSTVAHVKKMENLSEVPLAVAVRGLQKSKSVLIDKEYKLERKATYLGVDPMYGIKMKYFDFGGAVVYYNKEEFIKRFDIKITA